MKRIIIPMSVVCFLVTALLAPPKAEDENTDVAAFSPAGSKQDLDKGFQLSCGCTVICCDLAGDANDDGIFNAYDYLFAHAYGIQFDGIQNQVYPWAYCFDQMISGSLNCPQSYQKVLIHANSIIRPYLFYDSTITIECGTRCQ